MSAIAIPTESFAQAARAPGGLAGVLTPLFAAIDAAAGSKRAVLIDWAGGCAQHRIETMVATRFDQQLVDAGMTGFSFVVTTAETEHMRQAAAALASLRQAAPRLTAGVILNAHRGNFSFIAGSEQAVAFHALEQAAGDAVRLSLPAIAGDSWRVCENAGMGLPEVLAAKIPDIAARIRRDRFVAAACASEVAALVARRPALARAAEAYFVAWYWRRRRLPPKPVLALLPRRRLMALIVRGESSIASASPA